jgi:hypothetical protein
MGFCIGRSWDLMVFNEFYYDMMWWDLMVFYGFFLDSMGIQCDVLHGYVSWMQCDFMVKSLNVTKPTKLWRFALQKWKKIA